MLDWKSITNYKRKYHAYTNSIEWGIVKKTIIDTRSHGICEACHRSRGTKFHHLSYDHVFHELDALDEVIHVCDDCNKLFHPEHYQNATPVLQENDMNEQQQFFEELADTAQEGEATKKKRANLINKLWDLLVVRAENLYIY